MTPVSLGLLVELLLGASSVVAALLPAPRTRSVVAGVCCAALSGAGTLTGLAAMTGGRGGIGIPVALPLPQPAFAPDRLGGLFMVIASGVGVLVSVYGAASAEGASASRTSWVGFAVFLAGMQLVPAAGDAVSFLLMWEAMALGSTMLVLAEHASRRRVSVAAGWYAVMSQLSFLLLLAGFAVLAAASGGTSFARMSTLSPASPAASAAFVLLVLGFGCKAGLVPMHVWLPRAHPEAPSHVSAAMSAGMVKMGVYGIVLVCVRLLGMGPAWWGILLLMLGGASAVYGILQASVASDLKVLLAYSTTENVGLIAMAVGASVLLDATGMPEVAGALLLAGLLLTASHAAFKATLFLGAGSILHATGQRSLDRLGGLATRMPWTAAGFAVACAGAAALPISSGFAAEWVLLQALVHGTRGEAHTASVAVSIAMPLAVAAVALTAGLAVLTFVKAFGIAFLGRPRTPAAAGARESGPVQRVIVLIGAALVLAMGVVPGGLAAALESVLTGSAGRVARWAGAAGLDLPALHALLEPVGLLILAAVMAVLVTAVVAVSSVRHPRRTAGLAWGGGGERTRPRMQYTATSYAEPVVRVFDDVLQPSRDVVVTHAGESRYLVERVRVEHRLVDVVERRLYRPVLVFADRLGVAARRIQNGSVHRYLLFSSAAFLVVLIVAAS